LRRRMEDVQIIAPLVQKKKGAAASKEPQLQRSLARRT